MSTRPALMPSSEPDPLIGETVGSWRILAEVGAGGMGRVYRARHPEIGAEVAIKVLSAEAAQHPTLVDRFFAEARAVNLIQHENIVSLIDLARLPDGRPYIVMELLRGASLGELVARGPLPIAEVSAIARQVLAALGAAHAAGVVHRDLKPDNVFVTAGGHVKVLDFGLAKLAPELGGRAWTTSENALLGTPPYMAPEQLQGKPCDARSDLWALGVTLYEAASGQRPFPAAGLMPVMRQIIEQQPTPLRELRGDLPQVLDTVIARALEKDPARRWSSAAAMAAALDAGGPRPPDPPRSSTPARAPDVSALGSAPTESLPRPPGLGTRRWPSGWLLVLPLAAVVVAAVWSYGARAQHHAAGPDAGVGRREADAAVRLPPTSAPDDRAHFDATAYLPEATARARQLYPDAQLTDYFAYPVSRQGTVDLTQGPLDPQARYHFYSPARATSEDCRVTVTVGENVKLERSRGGCTGPRTLAAPRCTLRQLWRAAVDQGRLRPGDPGVTITYQAEAAGNFELVTGPGEHLAFANTCQPSDPD